ncbi:uncharacterized protein KY384_003217 [Bacidia gigantensis]|uniref:uncharacterized protein n=1 Tax=Bacidia gigantensis TaxID=2732470 RepID=UPI001D054DB5|nr:uncharacterized protein KY384_003217 [Bacidia gigantensis]KAG8531587.1 hypothetical protein KY384_003217 [Bacidia gigantensis]
MSDNDASSNSPERSSSSASEDESEPEEQVESLIIGRAKRATAGNRLSSLVDKEQDDEIELLFAENEQEEDDSFDEAEDDASDANLDSSSDEEDKEGATGNDELAGEEELQKRDQQERRKRKAKEMSKLPGMRRKKVKIDPTAVSTPAPSQPRAKRTDAPTRVSSRKQTVQNREVVHQRLVVSEKQRVKVMRQMEVAQKRKDASRPKALSQAQRLEEAARMERKNAQSLNRWEESEKKRLAEQKAKLEALHSRQLTGPVVSWWSGLTRWVNGKITQLGVKDTRESGCDEQPANSQQHNDQISTSGLDQNNTVGVPASVSFPQTSPQQAQIAYSQPEQFAPPQGPLGFLDGIHAYAALPVHQQRDAFTRSANGDTSMPFPPTTQETPMKEEYASRCLVILKNVDSSAQKLAEIQNSVLVKKHKTKLQKTSPEPCAITGQAAKFREPRTGLPYANPYAYKEIQRLRKGEARWSNLLDSYVGTKQTVARGVPERFRGPASRG